MRVIKVNDASHKSKDASHNTNKNSIYIDVDKNTTTYNNPIPVNRQEFLIKCQEHYHSVMNAWHIEYAELKRQRKV